MAKKAGNEMVCEIHGKSMVVYQALIIYGEVWIEPNYSEAQTERFPHAESYILGGCISDESSPERGPIKICRDCVRAQMAWLKKSVSDAFEKEFPAARTSIGALRQLQVSPPFPGDWPGGDEAALTYYAYSSEIDPPRLSDEERVAPPWAKIVVNSRFMGGKKMEVEKIADRKALPFIQGIWPLSKEELKIDRETGFEELAWAVRQKSQELPPTSGIWPAYSQWLKYNHKLGDAIRPHHPAFFKWLEPAISKEKALEIAAQDVKTKDGRLDIGRYQVEVYRDISGWRVFYAGAASERGGGGPEYLIDADNGHILSKHYAR